MEFGRPTSVAAPDASALAGDLRVVLGQLVRRLREQATIGDLTRSQLSVLGQLDRDGPTTASALARAAGMRPQSMAAIVAALEEAGYLHGAPDPADGRKVILSLTPTARQRFADGRLAREDWLFRAIRTQLASEEQAGLAEAIELLRRLADAP